MRPEVVAATYNILVRTAQERNVVTYSGLRSMIAGLPVRGPAMIDTLIAVSARSWDAKGVLLPVLVVNERLPTASGGSFRKYTGEPRKAPSDPRPRCELQRARGSQPRCPQSCV